MNRQEPWVERLIREAQERGEFDDLPGAGKPLPPFKGQDDENWWIRNLIEREHLDMTAAMPPQLALRKEAQQLPARILQESSEARVRDLLEDFNARVRELWRRPMDGPLVVVRTVDVERLVARWRDHRASLRPATRPAAGREPSQPPRLGTRIRRALGLRRRTR
jgi:DnaJ homologue, subfamily C, member 28, conserved domain